MVRHIQSIEILNQWISGASPHSPLFPAPAVLDGPFPLENESFKPARTLSWSFSPVDGCSLGQSDLGNWCLGSWWLSKTFQNHGLSFAAFWICILLIWVDLAAMNVQGLATQWDDDVFLRDRTRLEKKINVHPDFQKWCEPTRANCTTNAAVLLPCLHRLRETKNWKLPYLDSLQDELSIFYEKLGVPLSTKKIYGGSVELKKMLGFVKRRVMRREVTKDFWFHKISVGFVCWKSKANLWSRIRYLSPTYFHPKDKPYNIKSWYLLLWGLVSAIFSYLLNYISIPLRYAALQDTKFHPLVLALDPDLQDLDGMGLGLIHLSLWTCWCLKMMRGLHRRMYLSGFTSLPSPCRRSSTSTWHGLLQRLTALMPQMMRMTPMKPKKISILSKHGWILWMRGSPWLPSHQANLLQRLRRNLMRPHHQKRHPGYPRTLQHANCVRSIHLNATWCVNY